MENIVKKARKYKKSETYLTTGACSSIRVAPGRGIKKKRSLGFPLTIGGGRRPSKEIRVKEKEKKPVRNSTNENKLRPGGERKGEREEGGEGPIYGGDSSPSPPPCAETHRSFPHYAFSKKEKKYSF